MDFSNMIFSLPGGRPTAAIVLIVLCAALLYAIYGVLFYGLRKLSEKTKTDFDDMLIGSMNGPARVLVVVTALFLALNSTYPDLALGKAGLASLYTAALMLAAAFALDRGLNTMLNWYKAEIAPRTESKLDDEMIPVIEKILMVAVYSLALMMALSNLGIEITPFLQASESHRSQSRSRSRIPWAISSPE